jgi:hypothetical protein
MKIFKSVEFSFEKCSHNISCCTLANDINIAARHQADKYLQGWGPNPSVYVIAPVQYVTAVVLPIPYADS